MEILYSLLSSPVFDVIIFAVCAVAFYYAFRATRNARKDDCPYDCCCTCEKCLTKCEKWANEHPEEFRKKK